MVLAWVDGTRKNGGRRDRRCLHAFSSAEGAPPPPGNCATPLDRVPRQEARDQVERADVANLRPPSSLLRRMVDEARALPPEDRRELLRELAKALVDEPAGTTVKAS